jgi:hypothetical protein
VSAPTIHWVRDGVGFTPEAAASFIRAEADLGRRIDVNSTHRDYYKQLSMWRAWNAYVAGVGPYPGHSRALHPDASAHSKGLGLDSDDWRTPGFIAFMAERGWIRTAAGDPTEQHHFEYQSWRDQHRNRPTGGESTPPAPKPEPIPEEDDMAQYSFGHRSTGTDEWMLVGADLRGDDDKQIGYLVTTSIDRARLWARLYGNGWVTKLIGPGGRYRFDVPREQYVQLQLEARRIAEASVVGAEP